jgi:ABC-type enterochelin transport system ATPase subunit
VGMEEFWLMEEPLINLDAGDASSLMGSIN